ncbi:MAG: hypothetical protein H0V44_01780 [Planctomycetes bacterium]|nr:hypothetical protein [Planctomycetota bacterium]
MNRVATAFGLVLVIAGALLLWPLARTYWRYERTTGQIVDVFALPVGSEQARLQLVFEFTLQSKTEKVSYYGYNQADGLYRPIEDPVVDKARVTEITRRMIGEDPRYRIQRRVFYDAADPAGTAFIVVDGVSDHSHRYEVGMGCVVSGLLCMAFARRRRNDD